MTALTKKKSENIYVYGGRKTATRVEWKTKEKYLAAFSILEHKHEILQ